MTTTTATEAPFATRNGWPVDLCVKCSGAGYLRGYEFIDNARCWGCGTVGYSIPRCVAPFLDAANAGGDVAELQAQAAAAYVAQVAKRAKARARRAAKQEADAAARSAAIDARRALLAAELEAWATAHPAAVDATYFDNMTAAGTPDWKLRGLRHASGSVDAGYVPNAADTEAAAAAVLSWVAEANAATDVPAGRQVVTGEVLSVKERDGFRGTEWKMTVRDDRGFKVWGSVPFSMTGEWNLGTLRGLRVTFTATLEQSDRDPAFGFYSRPAKAAVAS